MLGLLGLAGLLVTLGLTAVMGARVLSDLGDGSGGATTGAGVTSSSAVGAGGDPGAPAGAPGAGRATDRDTLATAVEAYRVLHGSPPPDVAALVASGLLVSPIDTFELQVGGTEVTLVGRGACAGR